MNVFAIALALAGAGWERRIRGRCWTAAETEKRARRGRRTEEGVRGGIFDWEVVGRFEEMMWVWNWKVMSIN